MHNLSRHPLGISALGGALCLLIANCSSCSSPSSSDSNGDTPSPAQPDGSTGDATVLVGTFQVRLVPPVPASGDTPETPGYTSVVGKIYDGAALSQVIWEEAAKEGSCQLLTPQVPFCNEPCGGSAACVEDDTCQDYPLAHSAGKVKVSGLRTTPDATSFEMEPTANNYQPPAGIKLAYPAFAEGEEITFEASGDYFSAFTLKAEGISSLELLDQTIHVEPDQAVKLAWTPPAQAGNTKIHVKLDISHHGGTRGMIECDAEDTGSLELPAALVTKLLDLGVAGFPSIIITRKAVGSATIAPGRVDLTISSEVERTVEITGLSSCTGDEDCASGKKCQPDLTCQ